MEIRKYTKKDYPVFSECFRDYFINDFKIVLTGEQFEEICADIDGQAERGVVCVDLLITDNAVNGFITYQIDSEASDWHEKIGWGCIRELWIKPPLRGKGYGKSLLSFAENKLKEMRARNIYLTADDEGTIAFYKKAGYKDTGEVCKANDSKILWRSC